MFSKRRAIFKRQDGFIHTSRNLHSHVKKASFTRQKSLMQGHLGKNNFPDVVLYQNISPTHNLSHFLSSFCLLLAFPFSQVFKVNAYPWRRQISGTWLEKTDGFVCHAITTFERPRTNFANFFASLPVPETLILQMLCQVAQVKGIGQGRMI